MSRRRERCFTVHSGNPVAARPPVRFEAPLSHASGFLGAQETPRDTGSRQKLLAFAAIALFAVLSGRLVWMMSAPRGSSAAAVGPNSPLELLSLSHQRQNDKRRQLPVLPLEPLSWLCRSTYSSRGGFYA